MQIRITKRTNKNGTVREYLQIVESFWDKQKGYPSHRVVASLGRVDEIKHGSFDSLIEALTRFSDLSLDNPQREMFLDASMDLGYRAIIDKIWKMLGLEAILREIGLTEKQCLAVKLTVLGRLQSPASKRATQQTAALSLLPGETAPSLDDFYDAMDPLIANFKTVEDKLFFRQNPDREQGDLFRETRLDIVFFDTTSVKLYHRNPTGLFQRGYSKDHRGDLLQCIVAVVMTSDGDPLCHFVFPGNTADVKAFPHAINDIRGRFPLRRVILVSDTGCVSRELTDELSRLGLEYIVGARLRTERRAGRALDARGTRGKWHHYDEKLRYKDVWVDSERYLVVQNRDLAAHEKEQREHIIAQLAALKGKPMSAMVRNRGFKKYLRPSGTIEIDEAKVRTDEVYDGKWALRTSVRDFEPADIIEAYKSLWRVEQWFHCLKGQLDVAPVYHHKQHRVQAHIALCFLAMKVWSVFKNALSASHPEELPGDIWRSLATIRGAEVRAGRKTYLLRTEVSQQAQKAFTALGAAVPRRVTDLGVTPQERSAPEVASERDN